MNKRLWAFYAVVVVGIIGLIVFVEMNPISNFDISVTRVIQEPRGWNPTVLMKFISAFGGAAGGLLSIAIPSLIFFLINRWREGYFTFTVIFADLSNIAIKSLIDRPRPTLEHARILTTFTETGFPSGHVVHYFVLFGFLLAVMVLDKTISLYWRISIGFLSAFLILSISISRIYLGAHWATDVIGGYLFGMIYLGIMLRYYLKDPRFKRFQTS